MSDKKINNFIYIDGLPYVVRLLTGGETPEAENEWDKLMSHFKNNNLILHYRRMYSWCQGEVVNHPASHPFRGFNSRNLWNHGSASHSGLLVGFRPVLVPLDSETLDPCERFPSLPDGAVFKMGTLQMDGHYLKNPQNPTFDGDIPDYKAGAMLSIGDSSLDSSEYISWIKWGNLFVADRNLLKNISWDELNKQGFVLEKENDAPEVEELSLKPYRIAITETYVKEVEIYAENKSLAVQMAQDLRFEGDIELNHDHLVSRFWECRGVARSEDLSLHDVFGKPDGYVESKKETLEQMIVSSEPNHKNSDNGTEVSNCKVIDDREN